jgi:hypothetical protein
MGVEPSVCYNRSREADPPLLNENVMSNDEQASIPTSRRPLALLLIAASPPLDQNPVAIYLASR